MKWKKMKIKVAYNNIFRFLCNIKGKCSISQLFVRAHVDSFDVLFRKSCFSLWRCILQSNNHLVSAICFSSYFIYDSLVAKQWAKSIFRLNLWSSVSVSFSAITCQCVPLLLHTSLWTCFQNKVILSYLI